MRTLTTTEPHCLNCGRPVSECRAANADDDLDDEDLDDDELDAQADAILADLKAAENRAAGELFWNATRNDMSNNSRDEFDPDDVLVMPPDVTDVIANERRAELDRGRRQDPDDDEVTTNFEDDILDVPPIDYAALAAEQAKADRRR